MRGIAALFVVARHFSGLRGEAETQFSFLAVDMFFLLSGFVLAFSYGDRIGLDLTPSQFLKRRVIRLYPLFILGLSIGLAIAISDLLKGKIAADTPIEFLTNAASGLFLLPSLPLWSRPDVFPLLIPAWSLFFELYVANILFAFVVGTTRASVYVALAAAGAVVTLAAVPYFHSIGGGAHWSDFAGGFPRVVFSFFAGATLEQLYRSNRFKMRLPAWLVLGALTATFLPTIAGQAAHYYEAACVFIIFPALVFLGAQSQQSDGRASSILGDESYAIYVIHYPLLILTARLLGKVGIYPGYLAEALFLAAMLIIGYLLHHFYDLPVRTFLSARSVVHDQGVQFGMTTPS